MHQIDEVAGIRYLERWFLRLLLSPPCRRSSGKSACDPLGKLAIACARGAFEPRGELAGGLDVLLGFVRLLFKARQVLMPGELELGGGVLATDRLLRQATQRGLVLRRSRAVEGVDQLLFGKS